MMHDEQSYPDPFSFKPERFIKSGKINPAIKDPVTIAFGFGRRICPGRYMAYSSVWLVVASLLATVNITKFIDSDGVVIEPSGEYTGKTVK
jgi:cytochrome P450